MAPSLNRRHCESWLVSSMKPFNMNYSQDSLWSRAFTFFHNAKELTVPVAHTPPTSAPQLILALNQLAPGPCSQHRKQTAKSDLSALQAAGVMYYGSAPVRLLAEGCWLVRF